MNHKKRTGYIFSVEYGEASITILRPLSGELTHNGQYLVIYENAYGEVTLNILTIEEIKNIEGINPKDLEDVC